MLWLRAVVFCMFALLIVGGPFCRQVLGIGGPWLRPWVMFSGSGLDASQVLFFEGRDTPLDRYAALDLPPGDKSIRHLRDVTAVERVARRICRKRGPDADIRAQLREATRSGWKLTLRLNRNLCEPSK